MKCSICGTPRPLGADRCPTCGCRFRDAFTTPTEDRPRRKRSGAGCCLVGLMLFLLLTMLPLGLFLIVSRVGVLVEEFSTPERIPETPSVSVAPTVPAASEDCFAVAEGTLLFLPDRYRGGPVLQVPETVGGQTVTAIGPGCFAGCDQLTTILLPDTVTAIGSEAFAGCSKLRGLFVPKTTEVIGQDAFAGCPALEAVYIPSAVQTIASGCFDDCAALTYIFYEGYYDDWNALYSDYITPYTGVFCLDGSYYHGVK